MQQSHFQHKTTTSAASNYATDNCRLRELKVKQMVTEEKRQLVEVPYTESLAHTMNALVANKVLAVPVAAPPGQWIGAGGSMILEYWSCEETLNRDVLTHIAGEDQMNDGDDDSSYLEKKMSVLLSWITEHCLNSYFSRSIG